MTFRKTREKKRLPVAGVTESRLILKVFDDPLGEKATPLSRRHSRPVAATTLSPLEGPCFPSQILSRPVRLATWAARRCMAVTTDLGANELRWPMLSRNLQPDRIVALLLPFSQGAVRLRIARVSFPVPYSVINPSSPTTNREFQLTDDQQASKLVALGALG